MIVDGKWESQVQSLNFICIVDEYFFVSMYGYTETLDSDGAFCYRTAPLSTTAPSLAQINKRRLEFGVDVETFKTNDRRVDRFESVDSMDEEELINKRRRRLLDDERREELDARRRPLPASRPQPFRQQDEIDETLIQETQAALKTLSGSCSRDQSSTHSGDENDDANGFENLFEDKRSDKMLPSSPSQSSESADASQKSYSLHRQIEEHNTNGANDTDDRKQLQRSERERSNDDYDRHNKYSSNYDAPNFDEFVDSSSNELEIDMSDRNDDKYDDDRETNHKRKNEMISVNKQSLYNAYKAATASLPYSTQSAFKPPAEVKHRMHGPSLPSEPFGGYSNDHEKSLLKNPKQYTVLQPAGASSRAATALQEARTVPSAQPLRDSRPLAALSPPVARGTRLHSPPTIVKLS